MIGVSGQPISHRHDLFDQLAGRGLVDVLADAVLVRVAAAENEATASAIAAITSAGAAAADLIAK